MRQEVKKVVRAEGGGLTYSGEGLGIWVQPGEFADDFDINERPPTWEEDGYTVTRLEARTAPGCHDNCGLLAYTKNGKLVKIEGDPLNPYNQGRLCPRCFALDESLYNPDRVTYPMKRDPKDRGKDKWEKITWEEAYDIIEENWRRIISESGGEAISFMLGTGRDYCGNTHRLSNAVGSPNNGFGFLSGTACYLPRLVSLTSHLGDYCVADVSQYLVGRYDDPQFTLPELIVQWGCNAVVSSPDGFLGHWIVECMKRGSKLICVDPKLTWMAGKSVLWLPIRPGTDSALALGTCNIIIQEDLYDHDFVERWTYGFEEFAERCAEFPVERTAEICGLDAEDITAFAHLYAESKPTACHWGLAIDQQHYGYAAGCAIIGLWALTGNIDVPGGNIIARPSWGITQTWMGGWGEWDGTGGRPETESILPPEQESKRITGDLPLPLMMKMNVPDYVADAAITGKPYKIRSFYLIATNPLACMGADPHKDYEAMMAAEFNIATDMFITPTIAGCCDIVLPITTFIERMGVTGFSTTHVGSMKRAVTPVGEPKSDVHIGVELGRRFVPDAFPEEWKGDEQIADHWLRHSGMSYKDLAERTWAFPPFYYKKYEQGMLRLDGSPGFNTPTGRFEFKSLVLENLGIGGVPVYGEPPESPVSSPDLFKKYPVILTTGARRWTLFHSEHRACPSLRRVAPEPLIRMHPEMAEKYGISDGDMVLVENDFGSFTQKAVVTPGIRKDTVSADHGWWYPEREVHDETLAGTYENNSNCCIPLRPGPVGYGASYKSTLCRISKVGD